MCGKAERATDPGMNEQLTRAPIRIDPVGSKVHTAAVPVSLMQTAEKA